MHMARINKYVKRRFDSSRNLNTRKDSANLAFTHVLHRPSGLTDGETSLHDQCGTLEVSTTSVKIILGFQIDKLGQDDELNF
jgi:hypothetical protein